MPQAAEVHLLVLELDHRRDLGKPLDALDERVLDRFAEAACDAEKFLRRQRLVAKEDHAMLEPRFADRRDALLAEIVLEIDAEDLGAQGAGDRPDIERVRRHVSRT